LTIDTSGNVGITNALTMSTLTVTNGLSVGSLSVGGATINSTGAAEVAYLDGVTSNIQTQLDGKQASSSILTNTTASYTTAEQTKLSGIETGADVTDTANVTAAGALMDSEVTNLAQVKAFDSTDYATAAQGSKADSALQPTGDGSQLTGIDALPSQSAHSGKYLTTDGSNASWGTVTQTQGMLHVFNTDSNGNLVWDNAATSIYDADFNYLHDAVIIGTDDMSFSVDSNGHLIMTIS